jgi:RAQPRD family integrative conjugative element protein
MKTLKVLSATAILGLCMTQPCLAQDGATEIERKNLIAVVRQIEALDQLIDQAESAADADARLKFNYRQLRHELTQIQSGIQRHLNAPSRTPRALAPLEADYSQ